MSRTRSAHRRARLALLGLLVVACSDPPTEPASPDAVGIRILDGHDQVGALNRQLRQYRVEAIDAIGQLVRDVAITWSITSGGGHIDESQSVTRVQLDPATGWGVFAAAVHRLGPLEGTYTVTATAPDIPGAPHVTFSARGVTTVVQVQVANYWACFYYGSCTAAFESDDVSVSAGRSVGWMWNGEPCDVVFEDEATAPASSPVRHTGGHFRTFTTPGTYRYRCTLHSTSFADGMVGVVTVR